MSDENNSFQANYSINVKGLLMDFSTTKVMGIINLTPDSFFAESRFNDTKAILLQVEKMLGEGADIIDLGAFSSRPNANLINEEAEKKALLPALKAIAKEFPEAIISVDTYRSNIAELAIAEGAAIINDISAGSFDSKMFSTIAKLKVPYVLMHMQGEPADMQVNPVYQDVFKEIYSFFSDKLSQLTALKVTDIVLDVGFGFGKTLEHNFQLLKKLAHFQTLNCPVLVGLSRKGMVQKAVAVDAENALNGTTAAHVIALLNGANILRVHDVKEAKQAIDIVQHYQKQ